MITKTIIEYVRKHPPNTNDVWGDVCLRRGILSKRCIELMVAGESFQHPEISKYFVNHPNLVETVEQRKHLRRMAVIYLNGLSLMTLFFSDINSTNAVMKTYFAPASVMYIIESRRNTHLNRMIAEACLAKPSKRSMSIAPYVRQSFTDTEWEDLTLHASILYGYDYINNSIQRQ